VITPERHMLFPFFLLRSGIAVLSENPPPSLRENLPFSQINRSYSENFGFGIWL